MSKQNSEPKSTRSKSPKPRETEWVVDDEGEPGAPRVEREPNDEQELDVVQQAPEEAAWTPVEPAAATDDASADRASPAKRKRPQRKPRAQVATKTPAPTVAVNVDAATPVEPSTEHATSTAPVSKRKTSARTKKESSSTPTPEPSSASAPTPDAPGETPSDAPPFISKRKRGKQASEQPPTTPIVAEPETPVPSEVATALPDAPTEPISTLPSMEAVIAELAAMSVPQLVKRHLEVVGKAPRIKARVWLQRKLAWIEQTRRFGGLSGAARKRLDTLMAEIQLPTPTSRTPKTEAPAPRTADELPLGTRLQRTWHDREIVAVRCEGGWDCEGKVHRTLSAAAKFVTKSHVSGPAFFHIWRPKGGAR